MSKKQQTQEASATITPPANLEVEQSVLGAILIRPAVMDEVADLLSPADFYREAHARIFRVMLELYLRNEPLDIALINNLLRERGQLEAVGGPLFLMQLSEHVGVAINAPYYARIVKEKAVLRRMLAASQEIAGACLAPVEDLAEVQDWAEAKIYETKEDQQVQAAYTLEELIPETQAHIENIYNRKREILGVASGFLDLDHLTGGWQDGDLNIIAARPSMGKTALGLNISVHAGKHCGIPVAFFSMEQPKEQLVQRMLAAAGRINVSRLRAGKMETMEWSRFFNEAPEELEDTPIYIVDKPALTLMEIRAQARRLKSRHGIGLIVVDYLQLARDPKAKSQEQQVANISQGLKALAKEMELPVIALSQLNRDVEKRPNKRPTLPDLRGSGSIEQDADVIIFIYRDEVYRPDSKDQGVAEIILAKQRNGPTGKVRLAFLKEYLRFENLAKEPADAGF
jgi:replicative DNA helicase